MSPLVSIYCFINALVLSLYYASSTRSCSEPDYCARFEQTVPTTGKRLVGYTFMNETTGPHMKCIDHCAISCLCLSVNTKLLESGDELCELNFEDEQTVSVPLQDEPGYKYFRMSITDNNYKDPSHCENSCCVPSPCQNGGACTEVCDHEKYKMNCSCPVTYHGRFCQNENFRLVNGNSSRDGRVEVFYNNTWGTVCDDRWDDKDAAVVCRFLGFNGSAKATFGGSYDKGSGPIWLDDLDCVGEEASLFDCQHRGMGEHNCNHNEDAGVICES